MRGAGAYAERVTADFGKKERGGRGGSVFVQRSRFEFKRGEHSGKRAALIFNVCLLCRPQLEKVFLLLGGSEAAGKRGARCTFAQLNVQPDFAL